MPTVTVHLTEPGEHAGTPVTRRHVWDPAAGPLTFGRSATTDLPILSDTLSREHGRLEWLDGRVVLRDLDSRNGLKVNGQRVWQPIALSDGDQISVGAVRLRIQLTPAPAPAPGSADAPGSNAAGDGVGGEKVRHAGPLPPLVDLSETEAATATAATATSPTMAGDAGDVGASGAGRDAAGAAAATSGAGGAGAAGAGGAGGVFLEDSMIDDGGDDDERGEAGELPGRFSPADANAAADEAGLDVSQSLVADDLPGLRSFEPTLTPEDHAAADAAPPPMKRRVVELPEGRCTLGRDPACDAALDSLLVSRRHAEVTRDGERVTVRDLGSTNGTTVNGGLIRQATPLTSGDHVGIGPFRFEFDGRRLTCAPPQQGLEVRLQGVTVKARPRPLLQDVAATLPPGQVVGVIGPRPAEAAALADLLLGRRKPSEGAALFNGVDRWAHRRAFAAAAGQVAGLPAMHRSLKLGQVLRAAARLRLSADVPRAELEAHLEAILRTVDLADALRTRVKKLTPAQRLRAGLAVQLLTDPALVVLDTATPRADAMAGEALRGGSALDVALAPTLARIAEAGTLVVWLTATAESMHRCDRVLCLLEGQLVADGSPEQVEAQLGLESWDQVHELAQRETATSWRQRYLDSPAGGRQDRAARVDADRFVQAPRRERTPSRRAMGEVWRQAKVLTARRMTRLVTEPGRGLVDVMLAAGLGAGVGGVWRLMTRDFSDPGGWPALTQTPFSVLICLALTLGLLVGLREWLSDRAVLRRERAEGLRMPGYVLSKLLPLGLLAAAASGLLLAGFALVLGLEVDLLAWAWLWPVLALTVAIGVKVGLVLGRVVCGLAKGAGADTATRLVYAAAAAAVLVSLAQVLLATAELWMPEAVRAYGRWILPGDIANDAVAALFEAGVDPWRWSPGYGWSLVSLAGMLLGWIIIWCLVLLPRGRSKPRRREAQVAEVEAVKRSG